MKAWHLLGFFHCFCLNFLTTALLKRLTNPFLMASTLALHQNREMIDPDKFCSLCHATFNDPVMAQQHYVGKKHRKQETKLKLMAHYGRLADPAVTDSSGKGLAHTQSWFRAWLLEFPGPSKVCLSSLGLLKQALQIQMLAKARWEILISEKARKGCSQLKSTCLS